MKDIPNDVFTNYLEKDDNFILVKDPKHDDNIFHYTIWSINNIKDIFDITPEIIMKLDDFINIIKKKNYFENEKMYFTYPPTHNKLHLHIVQNDYISYRSLDEIYDYSHINNTIKYINVVNKINRDKILSKKYQLYYDVGAVILKKSKILLDDLLKIENFRNENNLNFIIVIREKYDDELIEYLVNNYKLINEHIISDNNYEKVITYDKILHI